MLLIDATSLQSEHRLRGVGAYLRALIGAIEASGEVRPRYLVSSVERALAAGLPPERTLAVFRPHRPAQVYWLYNEAALRAGLWHTRPGLFLAPDFNGLVANPFGKSVAVLHDLTFLKMTGGTVRGDLSTRLSALRWHAYHRKLRRADAILAVSESARQDALRLLHLPGERIHVAHHGVDHMHFVPSRGKGPYASAPPYFVHLGVRNDNKNQARLLQAFALATRDHPEAELYFAGPWSGADRAWLRTEAERLGVAGRARHLGYMPDHDLPSLYANAVAFVFPSIEEGFGLPVLEAMASGGAVITSDRSSLPEVAGGGALLVDPLSVPALADALGRLLAEPLLGEGLRARGRAHAATFTWDNTARRTLAILCAL